MGRTEDPEVAAVFALADTGVDLHIAWCTHHEPGSWGNVQRRYKSCDCPSSLFRRQRQLPLAVDALPREVVALLREAALPPEGALEAGPHQRCRHPPARAPPSRRRRVG